ncbi:transient receptor potential cation channel subfamily M member 2-like [Haliotis cracherodii]|uniref:transient receptor potential cation channel subfamily M member 2-like n=1 Tax=Haliotis cracherodii TaxID=6455 RepID=UPI0039EC808E
MDEDTWIRTNIRQRKCTVFSRLQRKASCKCWRSESEHQDPDSINDEDWSTSRNTASETCRNYGKIYFGEEGKTSRYVRIDVESDMSIVEHLLLEVWRLPKPKWMFSVIGDKHEQADAKEKEIRFQLKCLMKSFSNGQNIWITTEGINYGIAKMVGDYIRDEPSKYITPVGVYAWAGVDDEVIKELETEQPQLPEKKQGNRPSALYKHHLLVDDGSLNPSHVHKSFQDFRMRLETSMTKHSEGTSSIPLVAVLYCGWAYVLDGVQSAIENNVPVVVLKGTGGMADVFASVFINSKEDRTSSSGDSEKEWTGTVIDDVLRDRVKEEFTKVHEQIDEAGQYKILQCLQKRELITVVHIDEKETTLVNAVIQALLKSKTVPDVLQILDYYMPARLFDGEGAAAAALNIQEQRRHLSETTGMFLLQAMLMDEAESAQFIIDYDGVNLKDFFTETVISDLCKVTHCPQPLETSYNPFPRSSAPSYGPKEDVFRRLMMWAVQTDRLKCAALFWKKGTHLLTSSLLAALVLRSRMRDEENIGSQKTLEAQAILFQSRAIGLMNKCYDDHKERTMKLIQSQLADNIWQQDLMRCSLAANNRRIFATEAYRKYTERVWFGKINPPIQDKYKELKKMTIKEDGTRCARLGRLAIAPVTTYTLNLLFYVCFLGLFGHTLLFEMKKEFSALEGILVGWWFTFVWEEIRQIVKIKQSEQNKCQCCCRWKLSADFSGYFFDNYWNILDCVSLGFFLIGAVLMTIVHLDTSRNDVYEAARVILSLDIMFFTWRILQHLAIFRIMGPVLEMIFQMIKDLFPFLLIMSVFIISQGLAAHALLYPNRDWSPEALIDIPRSAFWNLFGELGLDEIEASETQEECSSNPLLFENDTLNECPSTLGKYAVPFLLALHMLLLNVLLLNILIARFSFTFQKVHDQTEWLAAWQKAKVILEYYSKPPVPPPFNVFFDVGYFLYVCCKSVQVAPKEAKNQDAEMDSWERSMGEYYLATEEFKSGSKRMSPLGQKPDNKEGMAKTFRAVPEPSSSSEVASSNNGMDISKVEDLVGSLRKQIQNMKSDLKEAIATQVCKEMRQVLEQYGPRSTETPRRDVPENRILALDDYDGQEENA